MGSLVPLKKWEFQGEFLWGSDIWAYTEMKLETSPENLEWKKTKGDNP